MMYRYATVVCFAVLVLHAFGPSAPAASPPADTFTAVRSLLESTCVRCHGADEQESDLRLDQLSHIIAGGASGPAIVPGKPDESLILSAIRHSGEDLQMPPDEPRISDEAIQHVEDWIVAGAPWPSGIQLTATRVFTEQERSFWSFQPLHDPTPPAAKGDWARNSIDPFVLARLDSEGLRPAAEADRRTLVRRIYLDLWGIPPTPQQTDAFLEDDQPRAFERLVDRLLDDVRYGQRFARFWLDLVRYAESDGFKADLARPHAWRYRDYVIRSFSADKPYDRFIQEQLAGDELFPDDSDARIATGYLRLWPLEDNQKDVRRQWTMALQDVTEVTSEVMLGLGYKCARCHDHKFDPILQRDYYRLQAFFASMIPRDDLYVSAVEDDSNYRQWEQETEQLRIRRRRMLSILASRSKKSIEAFPAYIKQIYEVPVSDWTPRYRQYAYFANPQIELARERIGEQPGDDYEQLREEVNRLDQRLGGRPSDESQGSGTADEGPGSAELAKVMCVTDIGPHAPKTFIGALSDDLSEETRTDPPIEPGFLSLWDPADAEIEPIAANPQTTGRRATLARWLTRPDHPLTTRVIVNRVWQSHFGVGIVATANDFGRQGTEPTHPLLLDWLSRRFVEDGWSLKKLHRLIVTSATYRQSSVNREADKSDPENRWVHRFVPHRLDAEQLRDSMLAVSGELDPTDGGPSVRGKTTRRSVYVQNKRNRPDEMLSAFDGPDMFNSCARRFVTTTPIQSLLLLNSEWSLLRARAFARSLGHESSAELNLDVAIRNAYLRCFAREPLEVEFTEAKDFCLQYGTTPTEQAEGLTDLCHTLLCSNEFIYVE